MTKMTSHAKKTLCVVTKKYQGCILYIYCSIDFESLPMPDFKKLPKIVTAKLYFFAFHFTFFAHHTTIFCPYVFFFFIFSFPFLPFSSFPLLLSPEYGTFYNPEKNIIRIYFAGCIIQCMYVYIYVV